MRGSREFFQRDSNFDKKNNLVDEGRKDPNTTIRGPSSARQRKAWRADDGQKFNAGMIAL